MKTLARPSRHAVARLTGASAVVAAAALGVASALSVPALASTTAGTTSVNFDVQLSSSGFSGTGSGSVDITSTAPATVAPGGQLTITATSGSVSLPSSYDGVTLVSVQDLHVYVKVPANSTYVSCALSGGSGLGSGTPTCSESGGKVDFSVPGPIPGGTTVTPPVVSITLKAGSHGSIKSKIYGTSYKKPGLTGSATLSAFGEQFNAKAAGYPSPSPVLTTTKIS
jgi:dehydratase